MPLRGGAQVLGVATDKLLERSESLVSGVPILREHGLQRLGLEASAVRESLRGEALLDGPGSDCGEVLLDLRDGR